jgi:hypothetical protein
LLYRFGTMGTATAMRADAAEVRRALPAGAVTAAQSYLTVKQQETSRIGPFVPFLVAFGLLGLVMSVLIVGNVVSGAVVAGYRRIGILKSIGFQPGPGRGRLHRPGRGARAGRLPGRPGAGQPAGFLVAPAGGRCLRGRLAGRAGLGAGCVPRPAGGKAGQLRPSPTKPSVRSGN